MSDLATVGVVFGLTFALVFGIKFEKLAQAYRDVTGARGRLRGAIRAMRSARLVFLFLAAVVFVLARVWFWLHGA